VVRDEAKFERLFSFAQALPKIRMRVDQAMRQPDLSREKVLATVVRLLEVSLIRIGNEEYAKENKSFGLTTMRNRHVEIEGITIKFQFCGKSGKRHVVEVLDRRLATIIRKCQDLPGQQLFEYLDPIGRVVPMMFRELSARRARQQPWRRPATPCRLILYFEGTFRQASRLFSFGRSAVAYPGACYGSYRINPFILAIANALAMRTQEKGVLQCHSN
jgi:Eukaryotic DNA topoisomerase I, catalytic core